jgi:hypothetical protein
MRWLGGALVAAMLAGVGVIPVAAPSVAWAQDDVAGVPVKVVVLDEAGAPIPTAVVRHPQEADRHRVNTYDGSWEAAVLYLPDGTELKFLPGMTIELEVSAPGYVLQRIAYAIRKRKNVVEVRLQKMALEMSEEEEEDEVNIGFGRDVPIDGQ